MLLVIIVEYIQSFY